MFPFDGIITLCFVWACYQPIRIGAIYLPILFRVTPLVIRWFQRRYTKDTGEIGHRLNTTNANQGVENNNMKHICVCAMCMATSLLFHDTLSHDDVIKLKQFLRYWPFVRGIHRSPVNSTHKGQSRGALMFSLICAWTNGWVNNRDADDLRRHRAHYDVIVMALTPGTRS